jgi:hypothetical protein
MVADLLSARDSFEFRDLGLVTLTGVPAFGLRSCL